MKSFKKFILEKPLGSQDQGHFVDSGGNVVRVGDQVIYGDINQYGEVKGIFCFAGRRCQVEVLTRNKEIVLFGAEDVRLDTTASVRDQFRNMFRRKKS